MSAVSREEVYRRALAVTPCPTDWAGVTVADLDAALAQPCQACGAAAGRPCLSTCGLPAALLDWAPGGLIDPPPAAAKWQAR
jgi:hypothetical protein